MPKSDCQLSKRSIQEDFKVESGFADEQGKGQSHSSAAKWQ